MIVAYTLCLYVSNILKMFYKVRPCHLTFKELYLVYEACMPAKLGGDQICIYNLNLLCFKLTTSKIEATKIIARISVGS